MVICWHDPLNPEKCNICRQIVDSGKPAPMRQKRITRQVYSLPCIHEGAILEWCNTCNGEWKHVRDCDKFEKCTRGHVSNKVRACVHCAQELNTPYVPDTTQQPTTTVNPQNTNSRRYAKRQQLITASSKLAPAQPKEPKSNVLTHNRRNHSILKIGSKPEKSLKWAYGITTVPIRRMNNLRTTIQTLITAGFDSPRLFIDIQDERTYLPDLVKEYQTDFGLPFTFRTPNIRTFGNYILGLFELYIREPYADRYILFQDDIIACKNLREYLEHLEMPSNVYLNLITYPPNEKEKYVYAQKIGVAPEQFNGWYPSNQMGKGAQGLVFSRDILMTLLSHDYIMKRPQHARGWQNVDGGIAEALKRVGYIEYVHTPSLIRHIGGKNTTMGKDHPDQPLDLSFKGIEWDALEMVK